MANAFNNGYALLIGVNDNAEPSLRLEGVERDVQALQAVLRDPKHCGYPAENVKIVSGPEATGKGIGDGLAWLRDKLAADESGDATAVVYFSGHGHHDRTGYYMLPYDVKLAGLRSTAIAASAFAADIADLKPRRLLVLLDCCHAGGVGDGVGDGTKSALPISAESVPLDAFASAVGVGAVEASPAPTSEPGGKSVDGAPASERGRAVISSSQGEEKSWMLKSGEMSVFTYFVIQALIGHATASKLPDGRVAIALLDLCKYLDMQVPDRVKAERQVSQRPNFKNSGMNFPLALVHGGMGYEKGVTPPDAILAAAQAVAAAPVIRHTHIAQNMENVTGAAQISGSGNEVNIHANTGTVPKAADTSRLDDQKMKVLDELDKDGLEQKIKSQLLCQLS